MLCFPTALSSGSKFIQWIALSTFWIACEPQTYFRSSPLSLPEKASAPRRLSVQHLKRDCLWSRTLSALTDPAHKVVANLTWYLSHRHKNELPYWLKPASVLAERELRSRVACNFTFCVSQTSVKQMWQGVLILARPRGGRGRWGVFELQEFFFVIKFLLWIFFRP